jgi:hypothetical protein
MLLFNCTIHKVVLTYSDVSGSLMTQRTLFASFPGVRWFRMDINDWDLSYSDILKWKEGTSSFSLYFSAFQFYCFDCGIGPEIDSQRLFFIHHIHGWSEASFLSDILRHNEPL